MGKLRLLELDYRWLWVFRGPECQVISSLCDISFRLTVPEMSLRVFTSQPIEEYGVIVPVELWIKNYQNRISLA